MTEEEEEEKNESKRKLKGKYEEIESATECVLRRERKGRREMRCVWGGSENEREDIYV